jgi:hypothetical protein
MLTYPEWSYFEDWRKIRAGHCGNIGPKTIETPRKWSKLHNMDHKFYYSLVVIVIVIIIIIIIIIIITITIIIITL